MPVETEADARLRAYTLMEAAQSEGHATALGELVALEAHAGRNGWQEAAFLAAAGQALSLLVRAAGAPAGPEIGDALITRARTLGVPSLLALALALRAVGAAGRDDGAALLSDTATALSLIEDEATPAPERCTVLVICAAAYNTMRLWELVDELYERASALSAECERPVQQPAVAVNRVLLRLEWAVSLLEVGAEDEALDQMDRAADAAREALAALDLPDLWRLDVQVCDELVSFVRRAHLEPDPDDVSGLLRAELASLDRRRAELASAGDLEVLPLLDALAPLGLLRHGRRTDATERIRRTASGSSSSGAGSFPLWVRAQVLTCGLGDEAVTAQREYASYVARQRWAARRGLMEAARSRISAEGMTLQNAALARDVLLDPLTGIANRRSFDSWLTSVHPVETAAALLLLDLDHFKLINDVHGHAVGDEVLRGVSRLLVAHVRPGDLALRLGGDELAVVVQHAPSDVAGARTLDLDALSVTATERAEALAEAVAATDWDSVAPGITVRVSVGVAVAFLGPRHPGAADRLYRAADAALYGAKSRRARERPAS